MKKPYETVNRNPDGEKISQGLLRKQTVQGDLRRKAAFFSGMGMTNQQIWSLLQGELALEELSPQLLEELAGSIGNSNLLQLLTGGGAEQGIGLAETEWREPRRWPAVNVIETSEPQLLAFADRKEETVRKTEPIHLGRKHGEISDRRTGSRSSRAGSIVPV